MAKVMIDIGHGGTDPGAQANGLVEKDINLKVGSLLISYLSNYDVTVGTTRGIDITLSSDARVETVKSFAPDLCVSIHHNWAASSAARGAEVIHAYYDQYDDKLANAVLDKLAAIGMPKRSAFTKLNSRGDDWYYMIRRIWDSNTSAIIVEGGFLSNPMDGALLRRDDFLMAEAAAIGAAIVDYLNLKTKTAPWWQAPIARLKEEGLITGAHDGNSNVTWGELASVVTKLLDKLK
jgi:N-acetylmuramoyl-L-alanine amidase